LKRSWASLTERLAFLADDVEKRQQACIPEVGYEELVDSPSKDVVSRIKECGTVVVRGVVEEAQVSSTWNHWMKGELIQRQAEQWLEDLKRYIAQNPEVKGFPADDKQVFEL
jgi:hypothetical protein